MKTRFVVAVCVAFLVGSEGAARATAEPMMLAIEPHPEAKATLEGKGQREGERAG